MANYGRLVYSTNTIILADFDGIDPLNQYNLTSLMPQILDEVKQSSSLN